MTPAEFRRVRELYGQTQKQWAETIGLHGEHREDTVRKYENGRIKITGARAKVIEMLREQREKQGL